MKTTKKHFELFKKECLKWEKRFELNGWSIEYFHEYRKGNLLSSAKRCLIDRTASVYLNTDWENESVTNEKIKGCAKHEMIHMLIGRLAVLAQFRYIKDDELYESEEELVYKLEKIIIN